MAPPGCISGRPDLWRRLAPDDPPGFLSEGVLVSDCDRFRPQGWAPDFARDPVVVILSGEGGQLSYNQSKSGIEGVVIRLWVPIVSRKRSMARIMLEDSDKLAGVQARDKALNEETGLTRNQFLIWLGQETVPDKPIFNEMSVFVIPGALDVSLFHQAFQHTLNEVDALRAQVKRIHGRPHVDVLDRIVYESGFLDMSDRDDPEAALDAWAQVHVDTPINLSVRPFESTLVRLAPDRYAWVLLCHQLLTDATSMSLVFERVSDWYGWLSGSVDAAPAAAPEFREYVEHDLEVAKTDRHRVREAYWTALTAEPPDPMVYYDGKSASTDPAGRRHRADCGLGPELTAAVRRFAGLEDVRCLSDHLSTYSVFCAALIAYMHKLSGHRRIAIGTTWHNRPRRFKSTIGLLMVQNPLAVNVDPDDTFLTLIKKVQAEAFNSMRHLPYAAGNPGGRVYDTTLNYVKVVLGPFAGWPVEHHWYRPSFGDGSMQIQVHDVAGHDDLTVSFDLNVDIFTSADRESVMAHYLNCLTAIVRNPNQPVDSVSMLTEVEQEQIRRWNRTERDYPQDLTVVDLIACQMRRRPGATAASCGDEQLTYAQLQDRVRSLTLSLRRAGVQPGVSVGIFLNRSLDLLVGVLGVLGAGGTYVPLDPAFPKDRLEYMLDDSGAQVLLTETRLEGSLNLGERATVYVDRPSPPNGSSATACNEILRPRPNDLAYVLYTSGSTGRPKGVEISHRALINFLCSMSDKPGCSEDDTLLAVTTLSFDIAGLELLLPLVVGGSVEIASRETVVDGRLLRARLDSGAFTVLQATPATWRMLLDAGWNGTAGLKALIGGEPLPSDLVQPLLARTSSLWNMYGPTETTIWSSVQLISPANAEITVGRPVANTGFHIMDSQLKPVPIGVAGELLISGDGLARGYRNRPELTAEKFVEVAPAGSEESVRMYRTGDLVRFRRDGQVVHLGRLDHQVKIRGFRIELGEIETALVAHESVQQAVVVAYDAHTAAARLVAYFVPVAGAEPEPVELRRRLRNSLPDYMVPQQIVPLPEFPLTPNGKIDRLQLPKPDSTTATPGDQPRVTSPMEARVAKAFGEVLGLSAISVDDDFFDLGGQSILAMRLVSKLTEELNVEVPLQMLFEASTVGALSRRLGLLTSTTPELRTVSLGGSELDQKLREVWRSALGSEPPSAGKTGSSLSDSQVDDLLAAVRAQFGVAAEGLSALVFRTDPTVSGLARALHDALNPPPALVVPLQPDGDKRPLFLIHAGGGYVFFYRALAARLAPDQPVYAIRAATRRDNAAHRFDRANSIRELAARYVDEIRVVQPEGPYLLGGACLGGVVAFEMAQQLRVRGESVAAPILLFDSFVGKLEEDWGDYASRTLSSVAERFGADTNASLSDLARVLLASTVKQPIEVAKLVPLAARSLARRGRDVLRKARLLQRFRDLGSPDDSQSIEQEQLATMRIFLEKALQLVSGYEPTPYPGRAMLLKATAGLDPEPLWTPWVTGGLETHMMPGEHLDMMEEPWVRETALLVRKALDTEVGTRVEPS